ncbi:MAG: YhcG family protein [Planctomycetes bacterium]|nr:YhcG family protein [Planctomycetota bacterium]
MTKHELKSSDSNHDFPSLVSSIESIHREIQAQTAKSVNVGLTIRNWLIGCYISEYELKGADRAEYGERLLDRLAEKLTDLGVSSCQKRRLYAYLRFYQTFPEVARSLTAPFQKLLPSTVLSEYDSKVRSLTAQFVLESLSYTHIEQLIALDSSEKVDFYCFHCIEGCWSVRELKRQIASLLFERSQLSIDKKRLTEVTKAKSEKQPPTLAIRDPYVFEFLGLKPTEVMGESELEDQLLDKLQDFLLELGHGFCFEARQRRILIGDTYYFIDLVFYHRILKCHVLVDLKLDAFSHENIGQLNTYVSWYAKNVQTESDNPPIGLLLCTEKDHALAEYVLAGMDNDLFVSKYQLELPSKAILEKELETERQRLANDSPG